MVSLKDMVASVRKSEQVDANETIDLFVDELQITNSEGYYIEESYIKKVSIHTSSSEERFSHKYNGTSIFIKTKGRKKKFSEF